MTFSECDLYKGHSNSSSGECRVEITRLGLEGEEMSRFNFFLFVKNADSVTPNCKLISFSVAELGGKNKQTF